GSGGGPRRAARSQAHVRLRGRDHPRARRCPPERLPACGDSPKRDEPAGEGRIPWARYYWLGTVRYGRSEKEFWSMTFAQLFALIGAERAAVGAPAEQPSGENGYASVMDALEMAGMRFG